ncbi:MULTISPECIES: hypothetical protein [unclassified Leptolyngbya]|uniref:hypothetical protein n=1 Tax=unclassified Leptolyngbya TaxID=2650499 RepID=UPI001685B7C7|nr:MULTISPECIES: hypothetical protein [unclassified Leptolyngbya]MBD1909829.1 hypothetical protein [Leptolyngbya sp. FACHB-8]MBD2158980.1 hypothetical protein [Leptolyngbya sp. FACHB-16]
MDVEMLQAQLIACERAILELNYLFSETLENQKLLLNYKDKVLAQADEERTYFLSFKMPLPRWARQHLGALEAEIKRSRKDMEAMSWNIQNCQAFKDKLEHKLSQHLEDA